MFLAIGCSNVTERRGCTRGWWRGRGTGATVGWGQQRSEGGAIGGSTVRVSSISKKRPSHNNYKSPKQFELKQSWKALRALNARWALPVYPVFVDEKSKASHEKSVKQKIALKKTNRTNIIATNFVWEQLITSNLKYSLRLWKHVLHKLPGGRVWTGLSGGKGWLR